ncbi:MAG: hypothetical protein HY532_02915, partial [Chloroflexi bacterium]|nr:hypothetical protein [Chloroflexota bacterium]
MGVSEGTAEVVEFEPNRKEVFRGDFGPMKPTVTHQFDFSDGVTTFTRRIQIEVHGPMWLMQPLIGTMVKRRNAGFLVNLKRVLEQQ